MSTRHGRTPVGIAVLLATLPFAATTGQSLTVTALKGSPTLDGKLDDACWQAAQWQGGFVTYDNHEPSKHDTKFAVCFDDRALYLAAKCPQPEPPLVDPKASQEEIKVYSGDAVEVFLQPGGDIRHYYQFASDAEGHRYDAEVFEEGGNVSRDENWGTEWQAMGAKSGDGWTLEIALPWASLPLKPDKRREWRLNVAYEKMSAPRQVSSWCGGEVARRESFGVIVGISADLSPYLFSIASPAIRRQLTLSGSEIAYVTQVANFTPSAARLTVQLSKSDPSSTMLSERTVDVAAQARAAISLPLSQPPNPRSCLRLQLLDPTGRLRAVRLARVTPDDAPLLRLKLTQPAFRNTIFPSERLTQVSGHIYLAASPEALAKAEVSVRLTDVKGEVLTTQRIAKPAADMAFALPWEGLAYGEYEVQVSLKVAGKSREEIAESLFKVKPGPVEVRVDALGRLVLNGKPFFPLFIYSSGCKPEDLRELKAAGFNLTHSYGLGYYEPPEKCAAAYGPLLDTCHQEGMPALDYALANKAYGAKDYILPDWLPKSLPGVERQVVDLRDKPGLLFWGLGEEFHSSSEDQAKGLRAVYDFVRRLDPYRPVYVGDYSPPCLAEQMKAADVGILWSYPDFYRAGGTRVPLDQLASRFEELWRLMGYRSRPIIGMPQLFNFGSCYPKGYAARRAPNHFEMRSMTYQALIHGAAGLGYYDAFGHTSWPGAWTAVKYLGRELSTYAPALLEPDAPPLVKTVSGKVDVLCKQHEGDLYVFTVSRSSAKQAVKFACRGIKTLSVLGEGRRLEAENGAFDDEYRPYEARLYTTSRKPWPLRSLKDIEAESEAADAALAEREKDNLASFVNGSYFEAEGDVYHLCGVNDSDLTIDRPYLKGKATLHFTKPETFTTVEVYGSLLERWKPALQVMEEGKWQPAEVLSSKLETTAKPNKLTVAVKRVTTDQVQFDLPGLYANEIRVFDR